jgi:hypothetical protein
LAQLEKNSRFFRTVRRRCPVPEIVRIAREVLSVSITQAKGDFKTAIAALEGTVVLQEKLPYVEPPYWYYPVRRSLGAQRSPQDDPAGAERGSKPRSGKRRTTLEHSGGWWRCTGNGAGKVQRRKRKGDWVGLGPARVRLSTGRLWRILS